MKIHPFFTSYLLSFAALAALAGVASTDARAEGCIAAYGGSSMGAILSRAERMPMGDADRDYAEAKLHKLMRKVGRICQYGFDQDEIIELLRQGNRAGTFCPNGRTWGWLRIKRYLAREIETRRMNAWLDAGIQNFEDENDLPYRRR